MAIGSPSVQSRSTKRKMQSMSGSVYLIGAGPGDPGLLTLRGAELLQKSDVVLYDGLSNPELLDHAPHAEKICVGKHGKSRIWRQQEIIDEILCHAKAGKSVARLKGGDPAVFARTAEEVEAVRAAGLPLEIVPGITAALAAGSFAGIPVTHRGIASAVALVTGHEEPGKPESALDWDALARFPGTLVIYMGVTTAATWTNALLEAGKNPGTPAALIRRCSLSDQQTIHCRLDEVAERLTPASKFRPPVIVILGEVTQLADSMAWLQDRPLFGQTVLVTRPVEQAESLAASLRDQGAHVLRQPAIRVGPAADWEPVDDAIRRLTEFDSIIFCSHNGVRYFLDRLRLLGFDARALAGIQIACVGAKTAATLSDYQLSADITPKNFRSEALAAELTSNAAGKKYLIIRASRGSRHLPDQLKNSGGNVTQIVAYENEDVEQCDPTISSMAAEGKIDWITVTSSATANSVARMFGDNLRKMRIATISPVTSETFRSLGYEVAAEADPYTVDSMIESLRNVTLRANTDSSSK